LAAYLVGGKTIIEANLVDASRHFGSKIIFFLLNLRLSIPYFCNTFSKYKHYQIVFTTIIIIRYNEYSPE